MTGHFFRRSSVVFLCICVSGGCKDPNDDGPSGDDLETESADAAVSNYSEPEPQAMPQPEGEESYFFVEIQQLDNFPYLSSGRVSSESSAEPRVLEFEFDAPPDGRLSLALAMDPPDGSFLGFDSEGLRLHDDEGEPIDGEFSGEWRWLKLLDEPDAGGPTVAAHGGRGEDVASLSIESLGEARFRATVTSAGPDVASTIGTGVFAVHRTSRGLFEMDAPAGDDLFELAQRGASEQFADALADASHFSSALAPGIYVVHPTGEPVFTDGEPDRGDGLERLAEDGNPDPLFRALTDQMDGVELFPDATSEYSAEDSRQTTTHGFFVVARPGDRLSFFAMVAQSNDLFLGAGPQGIPLFEGNEPVDGDFTSQLHIWDTGTEVNQRPGFGSFQAPRQPEPGAGEQEAEAVREVDDGFSYPPIEQLFRLTISLRE